MEVDGGAKEGGGAAVSATELFEAGAMHVALRVCAASDGKDNSELVHDAIELLRWLGASEPACTAAFVRAGGARTVLQLMRRHPSDAALQEAGCSLLTTAVLAEPAAHAAHAASAIASGARTAHAASVLSDAALAGSEAHSLAHAALASPGSPGMAVGGLGLVPSAALQAVLTHIGTDLHLRRDARLQLQLLALLRALTAVPRHARALCTQPYVALICGAMERHARAGSVAKLGVDAILGLASWQHAAAKGVGTANLASGKLEHGCVAVANLLAFRGDGAAAVARLRLVERHGALGAALFALRRGLVMGEPHLQLAAMDALRVAAGCPALVGGLLCCGAPSLLCTVLQTATAAAAAATAQRARNQAALSGRSRGRDTAGAATAVAAGAAGVPRGTQLSPAEAVAHAAADVVSALLAPPAHRLLLARHASAGGGAVGGVPAGASGGTGAPVTGSFRALLRCASLVASAEGAGERQTNLFSVHDDFYLLPLPAAPPDLADLLARAATMPMMPPASPSSPDGTSAAGGWSGAWGFSPGFVDVGERVSGAMARVAVAAPSPTEPCAWPADERAASLSLLPEDLASLVINRLLDDDLRAAAAMGGASRALRRLQRAACAATPCVALTGDVGSEVAAGTLSAPRLLRQLRASPVQLSFAQVGGLRSSTLGAALAWCGGGLLALDLFMCTSLEAAACATIAKHAPLLQALDLSGVASTDDASLVALARGCPALRFLSINHCVAVGDSGLQALAARCAHLEALHLFSCARVTPAGVLAVAARCPRLQALDVTGSAAAADETLVGLARVSALNAALYGGTDGPAASEGLHRAGLRALGAGGSDRVSDDGVTALAAASANLEVLHLVNCSRITHMSTEALLHHCPRLRMSNFAGSARLHAQELAGLAARRGTVVLGQGCL